MSEYWYYECLDHTPTITSEEFTQHRDDYAYKQGVKLALSRPIPEEWWDRRSLTDDYFAAQSCRFLVAHPTCNLGLVNEYNERRPLLPAPLETP